MAYCLSPEGASHFAKAQLLHKIGFEEIIPNIPNKLSGVEVDDILDARVCAWTAEQILKKQAECLPKNPPRDSRGLRMEIWY